MTDEFVLGGVRLWVSPTLRARLFVSAAFFHGFEVACLVAAGVAIAGALAALALLPAHPTARGEETPEPDALGAPATASATD